MWGVAFTACVAFSFPKEVVPEPLLHLFLWKIDAIGACCYVKTKVQHSAVMLKQKFNMTPSVHAVMFK
jgi:hypothetical protein